LSFSFPYSRRRRYLTGIDWSIGTLDYVLRQETGVGNLSQVILELDGDLPPDRLRKILAQISDRLLLLHGQVARDFLNLAPYWKVPRTASTSVIPLKVVDLPTAVGDAAADALLAAHVNTPLQNATQHLRFLLVRLAGGRSRLGMVFDHRLLDAFGAETFLDLIEQTWQGHLEEIAPRIGQTEPPHLDAWGRQFAGGKTMNRFRLNLAARPTVTLPRPLRRRHRPVRFVHDSISPEQAAHFVEIADQESGLPILLPSALARAICAVRPAFADAALDGRQFLVAVSVDCRGPDQKWEHLLFNHLSFMGFGAPAQESGPPEKLVPALRDQLFAQMKEDIPGALRQAAMLTRIAPHALGSRLSRGTFGGLDWSFYFACLRDSPFSSETFLGLPAINLMHTPRLPSPPGLGICLTFFRGRMNLVLSYQQGFLDDIEAQQLMQRLKSCLIQS
jgi:hypothetical protein